MARVKISEDLKTKIINDFNAGLKQRTICDKYSMNKSVISKIIKKFRETGTVKTQHHGGRPRKSTTKQLENKMNLNCDTYIKQEFINAEDNLMHNIPNSDLNISVKNEPITDEDTTSYVSIKTEPPGETTGFSEGTDIIKNENQLSNQITVPGDSFIIYELETPPTTTPTNIQNVTQLITDFPQLNNQINVNNCQIQPPAIVNNNVPLTSIKQSPITFNITSNRNSSTNGVPSISATPTLAPPTSAPPVLLNAQLRKRNKVVIPLNPIDKRTRYNIEGTTTVPVHKQSSTTNINNPVKTLNSNQLLNTGNKKIINHLIKRKTITKISEKSNTNLDNSTQQGSGEKANITNNEQQTLNPLNLPHIEQIASTTQTEVNLRISSPTLNTEKTLNLISLPETSKELNINLCSPPSLTTTEIKNEIKDSPTPPPAFTSELRVKCLCSLTANNSDNDDNSEIKTFFKQMFEETRLLNKKQQRKVKMSLLQAISDAEELMEQGKCCGF